MKSGDEVKMRVLSPNSPAVLTAEKQAIQNQLMTDSPPRITGVSSFRADRAPSSAPPAEPLNPTSQICFSILPWVHKGLVVLAVSALILLCGDKAGWAAEEGKKGGDYREVVQKLQARYEQTKDLQADFKQTTKIEGFATPITSSGKVYIKKPGRLRWDYLDPNAEEIYVNGNEVKMYVPEHKQVLVGKLTQMAASQAPLELLQGVAKLEDQYDIDSAGSGDRAEGGVPRLTLIPKGGGSESVRTVAKIVLDLNPKSYYIQKVAIHETSGNVATFQFSNLKGNTGLKNALFEFTVPPGVEVVKAPTLSPP